MKTSVIKQFVQIAFGLLPLMAHSATWYVRPCVYSGYTNGYPSGPQALPGVYGTQDGTSYTNAWNGLQSIAWGSGGVNPGDTIYVCGAQIYSLSNIAYFASQATVPIRASGVTIRMDYQPDPGLVFAGALNHESGFQIWFGPDANGVYWSTNLVNGRSYPMIFEVDGTNITRLNTQTNTTWVGGLGSMFQQNNTNYIKTVDGSAPSGNIAFGQFGWTFNLNNQSNISFVGCNFIGGPGSTYGLQWSIPGTNFIGANHIFLTNCVFLQDARFGLYAGNDGWVFDHCEIGYCGVGIYGYYNSQTRGPDGIMINQCYIHDTDTSNYPDIDGHGIGSRDTSNWIVTGNRLERTGAAIDFYVDYGWTQTNNLIAWNFVKDTHVIRPNGTSGGGIVFEGQSVRGQTVGNRMWANIVMNAGINATNYWEGRGLACGQSDHIEILNNTVYNCYAGIAVTVATNLDARVENNIIINPATFYCQLVGNSTNATLTLDYNLYYPIGALTNQFSLYPGVPHDQHSLFGNPLFISSVPSTAADFRLGSGSIGIAAGTLVGIPYDFAGTAVPTATSPDMGAFQSQSTTTPPAPASNLHVTGSN